MGSIFVLFLRFLFRSLFSWKIQTWPLIRFLTASVTYGFFYLLVFDRNTNQGMTYRGGGGGSFHQPGIVNENVLESDFEPLCDGTTRRRSLADLRLLEGM